MGRRWQSGIKRKVVDPYDIKLSQNGPSGVYGQAGRCLKHSRWPADSACYVLSIRMGSEIVFGVSSLSAGTGFAKIDRGER